LLSLLLLLLLFLIATCSSCLLHAELEAES